MSQAEWLAGRETLAATGRAAADACRPYEDSIKRPYFHIKPLDTAQLSNWVRYLGHVEKAAAAAAANKDEEEDEKKGDAAAVGGGGVVPEVAAAVLVYERCLVPCASYPGE